MQTKLASWNPKYVVERLPSKKIKEESKASWLQLFAMCQRCQIYSPRSLSPPPVNNLLMEFYGVLFTKCRKNGIIKHSPQTWECDSPRGNLNLTCT